MWLQKWLLHMCSIYDIAYMIGRRKTMKKRHIAEKGKHRRGRERGLSISQKHPMWSSAHLPIFGSSWILWEREVNFPKVRKQISVSRVHGTYSLLVKKIFPPLLALIEREKKAYRYFAGTSINEKYVIIFLIKIYGK